MSGPKVIRIVTREEMEKRCSTQIQKLEKAIAQLQSFSERHNCLDEKLAEELNARLQSLRQQDASEYATLERQIPQQLTFLRQKRKDMAERIERKIVSSRKSFSKLLQIRHQLVDYCKRQGLAIPESITTAPSGLYTDDVKLAEFRQQVNAAHTEIFSQAPLKEKTLSTEQAQLITRLGANLQSKSFEQWKASIEATDDTPEEMRLNKLLAQLRLLEEGDSAFVSYAESANELLAQIDSPLHVARCDSLVIDITRYIATARELESRRDAASELLLEIKEYLAVDATDESHAHYANLESQLASSEGATLEAIVTQARALRDAVKSKFESNARRRALLSGLADLGYTVNENLETAWAQNGSLVVARNSETSYGVELLGGDVLDKCQVRVVSDGSTSAGDDKDAEEAWCEDFGSMRKALSNSGAEITVAKATPVGQVPLKTYTKADQRWKRSAGVKEKTGRYRKPD